MEKILITGTGRCGTTFLIKLFSFLDFDTGYNRNNYKLSISSNCNSGMEKTYKSNNRILHLWTFKTPTLTLKKYKNVKSILMVLLFLLLFGWRRSERRNMILKFCWSCLFFYPTFR